MTTKVSVLVYNGIILSILITAIPHGAVYSSKIKIGYSAFKIAQPAYSRVSLAHLKLWGFTLVTSFHAGAPALRPQSALVKLYLEDIK